MKRRVTLRSWYSIQHHTSPVWTALASIGLVVLCGWMFAEAALALVKP